jgi:hypothetical protein
VNKNEVDWNWYGTYSLVVITATAYYNYCEHVEHSSGVFYRAPSDLLLCVFFLLL